jgi:hypothetical protein
MKEEEQGRLAVSGLIGRGRCMWGTDFEAAELQFAGLQA